MGRDRHPRERQQEQLARKHHYRRANCDRILIVCEGKTESYYFDEIRCYYQLPTANIMALPSQSGTQPLQVVEFAKELVERGNPNKGIEPRTFDQVYAVFDRDDHRSYFDALKHAESLDRKLRIGKRKPITFKAIASVPCFELWLLLHYEDIQALLHRDEVSRRLKRHWPDYKKGCDGIFKRTQANLRFAIERAERLAQKATAYDDSEPSTGIVELVKLLINLRAPQVHRSSESTP